MSNINQLLQNVGIGPYSGQFTGFQPALNYQPVDKRTKRQKLEAMKDRLQKDILKAQETIAEIDEAIKLLDESPILEKIDNLISKLLG